MLYNFINELICVILLLKLADNKEGTFVHDNYVTAKTMFYDMEIDIIGKHIITACQDRNFRLYNIVTGKNTKSFKGSIGDEEGSLIKVIFNSLLMNIKEVTNCFFYLR